MRVSTIRRTRLKLEENRLGIAESRGRTYEPLFYRFSLYGLWRDLLWRQPSVSAACRLIFTCTVQICQLEMATATVSCQELLVVEKNLFQGRAHQDFMPEAMPRFDSCLGFRPIRQQAPLIRSARIQRPTTH